MVSTRHIFGSVIHLQIYVITYLHLHWKVLKEVGNWVFEPFCKNEKHEKKTMPSKLFISFKKNLLQI